MISNIIQSIQAVEENDKVAVLRKRFQEAAEVFQDHVVAAMRVHESGDTGPRGRGAEGGRQLGRDGLQQLAKVARPTRRVGESYDVDQRSVVDQRLCLRPSFTFYLIHFTLFR